MAEGNAVKRITDRYAAQEAVNLMIEDMQTTWDGFKCDGVITPHRNLRSNLFLMLRYNLLILIAILAIGVFSGCGRVSAVTTTPEPTATLAPSATPVPPTATAEPLTGAALYEQVARDAARPLDTRSAVGLPSGNWEVASLLPGEVTVTYPMTVGMDNGQTVRQGQRQIAAIVVALFDADPDLTRVNVIGTLPLGEQEAPAISVVLTREEYASWSGNAAELPGLQVSQRLR